MPDLIKGAKNRRWTKNLAHLRSAASSCGLSKRDWESLIAEARRLVESAQSEQAVQLLFAGLVLSPAVLPLIQKDGFFRLSRCDYAPGPLKRAAESLYSFRKDLPEDAARYVESVHALHRIAARIREQQRALYTWLDREREHAVKASLVTIDWLFLEQAYAHRVEKPMWAGTHTYPYSPEHMAEGFSAILAMYREKYGPLRSNTTLNAEAIARGEYVRWIVAGTTIVAFREWEIAVDRLGYHMVSEDGVYRLRPPSVEFHRAVELGFIQTAIQRQVRASEVYDPAAFSFAKLGQRFADELRDEVVELVEEPVRRYRFNVPVPLIALAKTHDLVLEERMALMDACRSFMAKADEILALNLSERVSVMDLFYTSRALQLLRCLTAEVLLRESKKNFPLVVQSLVPVFESSALVELLGSMVGKEKAVAVIELLSLAETGHVDIQYRPLVTSGPTVMTPVNILASSNVYRNPLMVSKRRLHEDGTTDPLAPGVAAVFARAGIPVKTSVRFSGSGFTGEVDVLALHDGVLVALECKHSLLPTGLRELLTSVDYVTTAADQLSRFRHYLATSEGRRRVAEQTGFTTSDSTKLVTGIVMSNRMLMGYRLNGHSVRGNYEIEQFVTEGTVLMGEESKSFWVGPALTGEDLRRYFEDDITYVPLWKAMTLERARHEFESCTVETEIYVFNHADMAAALGMTEAEAEIRAFAESIAAHGAMRSGGADTRH